MKYIASCNAPIMGSGTNYIWIMKYECICKTIRVSRRGFFYYQSFHRKVLLRPLSRKGCESVFLSCDLDYLTHVFIYHSLEYGISVISWVNAFLLVMELPWPHFLPVESFSFRHFPPIAIQIHLTREFKKRVLASNVPCLANTFCPILSIKMSSTPARRVFTDCH